MASYLLQNPKTAAETSGNNPPPPRVPTIVGNLATENSGNYSPARVPNIIGIQATTRPSPDNHLYPIANNLFSHPLAVQSPLTDQNNGNNPPVQVYIFIYFIFNFKKNFPPT